MISGPVCLNQASDDQSSSMCNLLTYPFLLITFTTNYSYHCWLWSSLHTLFFTLLFLWFGSLYS